MVPPMRPPYAYHGKVRSLVDLNENPTHPAIKLDRTPYAFDAQREAL